jgi:ATP-binding cassette, subfamily B (MDR/TAP), member 1
LGAIGLASAASEKIFNTIDRKSPIDVQSSGGTTPEACAGHISFRNVKLIYPSRPNTTVLDRISLDVPAGRITAIVGPSGSGKSSIVGLLERFYPPIEGEILMDSHNIADLNLRWLRSKISLVSQEPTLFAETIYQNIAYGLVDTIHESVSLHFASGDGKRRANSP